LIAKLFLFLSPLRGFVMVDDSCAQGQRFAHPCLLNFALSGLKIRYRKKMKKDKKRLVVRDKGIEKHKRL